MQSHPSWSEFMSDAFFSLLQKTVRISFLAVFAWITPAVGAETANANIGSVSWSPTSKQPSEIIIRDPKGTVIHRIQSAKAEDGYDSAEITLKKWDSKLPDGTVLAPGQYTAEIAAPTETAEKSDSTIIDLGLFKFHFRPWKVIGLTGALLFGCRWLVQLWASKQAGRSTIPFSFWVMSIVGSGLTLSYYIFGKNDSVGIINNLPPFLVAAANLYIELKRGYKKTPPVKDASE
jgi:lipid-A-disaccharide synthase-like uncharacterized protein